MSRSVAVLVILACLCSGAAAYDWPVDGAVLTATFAQLRGEVFGAGVTLGATGTVVRPVAAGEVVFRFDPARHGSSIPHGPGAQVVIEHAERVRTVYSHLAPGSVTRLDRVSASTPIGALGDSGNVLGPTLGLEVFDLETGAFLNPLAVLPQLVDRQPPVIVRALLRRGGVSTAIGAAQTLPAGTAEVLVEAYDLRQDVAYRWRLAPYSLALSVNGRQTASVAFDSLRHDGERLVTGAGRPASSVWAGDWLYNLGEVQLQVGETRLELFVRDFAGNESTREYFLSIRG